MTLPVHAAQPTLAGPDLLSAAGDPPALALIGPDGTALTHSELREQVAAAARQLPDPADGRRLVHVPIRADLAGVTAYLAVLAAGHCALVTSGTSQRTAAILAAYPPDVIATGEADQPFDVRPGGPAHLLHPDLALLLSTSGSTGSPKLVRLSRQNVVSNAAAIAQALGLTPADRGITSLPLHYCFGLSVLHSHLIAGASVVLTEASVLDPDLWSVFDTQRVSTLAVVPHMVELLTASGELERGHPSLRLVAQAGGRLPQGRVRELADLGRRQGFGLAVMYGQTEATARICVLDPALVAEHPDAVGRPVPGTTVHLDPDVPGAVDGAGEVVVRGPGVMMGYAVHADDLALGPMLTELRTGDLGRLDEHGLLRIVGRRSGFVKVMGLRIDLAAVESALEATGLEVCVTGDDEGLRVAVEPTGETPSALTGRARRLAAETSGVGVAAVTALTVPLARLENGKVDRAGCDALVRAGVPQECEDTRREVAAAVGADRTLAVQVADVLRALLARDEIDLDATFVQLGGDSLSHVQASVKLTSLLGELPGDWHHRPLRDLVERAGRAAPAGAALAGADPSGAGPQAPDQSGAVRSRVGAWLRRHLGAPIRLETSVLLRAIAVLTICGTHAGLFRILGGAHTLLVVAGFSAGLYALSAPSVAQRWRGTGRLLVGIAVPTVALALLGLTYGRYGWDNVFLANWLVGDIAYGNHNELWFVDALVASTIFVTALLSIPFVARRWRSDPWPVAFTLVLLALVPRFVILGLFEGVLRGMMPTVLWLFAIGLALATARTATRRRATMLAMLAGVATFFPDDPVRNLTILAGAAALAFVPRVAIPSRLVPLVATLGAASLHIYLVQFHVLDLVPFPPLATLLALAAGVLLWRVSDGPVRRLQHLLTSPRGRRARHTAPSLSDPLFPVPERPTP